MQTESATNIIDQLRSVMIERGPCEEFLMDNSTAFRSAAVEQFADRWGISLKFRAAYAPGGNGIVERNHRTIKRIAARGAITRRGHILVQRKRRWLPFHLLGCLSTNGGFHLT